MQPQKPITEVSQAELRKALWRERYFAHVASFMRGAPRLRGERLRKTLACCPPKQYRSA